MCDCNFYKTKLTFYKVFPFHITLKLIFIIKQKQSINWLTKQSKKVFKLSVLCLYVCFLCLFVSIYEYIVCFMFVCVFVVCVCVYLQVYVDLRKPNSIWHWFEYNRQSNCVLTAMLLARVLRNRESLFRNVIAE